MRQGTIPAELASLPALAELDLSRNALSGPPPLAALAALPSLRGLRLGGNLLSGVLPAGVLAPLLARSGATCMVRTWSIGGGRWRC